MEAWNRPFVAAALATALCSFACANTHHATWTAQNPDWIDTFPDKGSSLHETLAGMTAPRRFDDKLLVSKLEVLRLEDGGARILTDVEVEAAIAEDSIDDFGIVANIGCISELDTKVYRGEKVGWTLLLGGKLVAWDVPEFSHRCAVNNNFLPAGLEHAEHERLVTAHRDGHFPRSVEHVAEWYGKGVAYLGVGRVDDAEKALSRGDEIVDVGSRGRRPSVRGDGPRDTPRLARDPQIERIRQSLAAGIAAKRIPDVSSGSP